MSKCYLLFAEGLEECEGLITLDILRRAGLETYTVSIQEAHTVVGAHGVPITCDRTLPELLAAPPELVVLPGGMPGTTNLAKSPAVEALVRRTLEHGGRAAAICAAPSVLAQHDLLSLDAAPRATPALRASAPARTWSMPTLSPTHRSTAAPSARRSRSHSSSCVCSPTSRPPRTAEEIVWRHEWLTTRARA
ncbi:MAG: DJ-1/PfpI family protein [Oscillospiraceae bacterium]